jgi:long-chain acyl-CoA synthetase
LPHVWTSNRVLQIARFGAQHSLSLFWDDAADEFVGWYVNLQVPLERSPLGFDTLDRALDVWIDPDGSWRWKDENDLAACVALELISADEAAEIRAEGERVIAALPDLIRPASRAGVPTRLAAARVAGRLGRNIRFPGAQGECVTSYTGRALERPAPLSDVLRRGLDADPDGPALITADTEWTWQKLQNLSSRLAGSLLELGLEPGDRGASLMPNRPTLVAHYLACFKAGLVATPLNYRYMAPEIDHALGVSKARLLLAHVERERDLEGSALAGRLPLGRISYGGKSADGPTFDELVETAAQRPLPPPSAAAPALIFFTSGSTGPPRGVTHSHETVGWMLAIAAAGLELTPRDLLLAGSSLSHVGAFYVSFGALSVGAGIVVARTFDGDELLPLLRERRPTVLSMLPSALFALTRDHGAAHDDFASLRLRRAAGDTVSTELEREFTELSGFAIDEAYGMTETGLVTVSPPSALIKPGSVGQVVPGVSLSVRDEDGAELAAGAEGRLWIKTPAATVGYWRSGGDGGDLHRWVARLGRRDASRRRRVLPLLRSQEADHRPRRLEHLPPGDRGRVARTPERRERRTWSGSTTPSTERTCGPASRSGRTPTIRRVRS